MHAWTPSPTQENIQFIARFSKKRKYHFFGAKKGNIIVKKENAHNDAVVVTKEWHWRANPWANRLQHGVNQGDTCQDLSKPNHISNRQ